MMRTFSRTCFTRLELTDNAFETSFEYRLANLNAASDAAAVLTVPERTIRPSSDFTSTPSLGIAC